jgi:hypothetical protein
MLVAVAFFAMIAAIVIVPKWLRERDRARMYDTLRVAYEKGQPVPPEMVDAMLRPASAGDLPEPVVFDTPAHRDLRRGVIWLAIGIGFVAVGAAFYAGLYYVGGAQETFASFAAIGAIPACVGIAYLGLWYFGSRKSVRP